MVKRTVFQRLVKRMGFVLAASLGIMFASIFLLTLFYYIVEGDQVEQGAGAPRSLFDWLYFTVITTRTIGFGDITPKTSLGKLGTIFNALLPASVFMGASLVVLQNLFSWLEDSYRRARMARLSGHHIIVADEELLESIVSEYTHEGRSFVCLNQTPPTDLPPRLQELLDQGTYYCGDPTRDETLDAVNVKNAEAVVIATADDNINLYVLVTVRGLAPSVKTVVRVNRMETESKFRSVGAGSLLPAGPMLGRMLTQAASSPVAHDLLVRLQTGTQAPTFEQIAVTPQMVGETARKVLPSSVAVFRGGTYHADVESLTLAADDVIVCINWTGGPA